MNKIYALKDPNTLDIKYVGQTSLSLYRRLTRHVSESLTKKEFSEKREWIKGLIKEELCPLIELLEVTDNPNDRERYWINKYRDTIFNNDNFINYSKANAKKVYALIIETSNILEFKNAKEAAIKTNTPQSNIVKAIHCKGKANNLLWSYDKNFIIKPSHSNKKIIITNVKSKEKIIFNTQKEASEFIGKPIVSSKNGIKYALEHKDKEYKGYFWDYGKEHLKLGEFRGTPEVDNPEPSL